MRRLLLLLALLYWAGIAPYLAEAQEIQWKPIFHIQTDPITLLDLDNKGNIFCTDEVGNINQYNESGASQNHYSPTDQGGLSQLQMSRTVNLFTFSRDLQKFEILDRFLNPVFSETIRHPDIGWVRAASLGNNHIVWLYDETDFSLIQYDYRRNRLLQEQQLQLFLDGPQLKVLEILEYQNILFVRVENKGIFLFDNQGNLVHSLSVPSHQKLSLYKNKLFLISNERLLSVNYLSGKEKQFPLPAPSFQKVAIGKDQVVFYGEEQISSFTLPTALLE